MHLTNNCLQVFGENYGKHEDGNTLSFDVLRKYLANLQSNYVLDGIMDKHIIPRIKDLILDTLTGLKRDIQAAAKKEGLHLSYSDMIL